MTSNIGTTIGKSTSYTPDEQRLLLQLARQTLEALTAGRDYPDIDLSALPPALREKRASFITLHEHGELRGCTGTLVARSPLAEEVIYTTGQTAFQDPRFMPVQPEEVPAIHIEISVLTPPVPLNFASPNDIPRLIRPHVDGVTLSLDGRRATFLPQVWDSIADPVEFLTRLSEKMGMRGDAWKQSDIRVDVYQAITIEEPITR